MFTGKKNPLGLVGFELNIKVRELSSVLFGTKWAKANKTHFVYLW